MFSKLLKHEWKANAGLLGILSLCALGAGLLGIFVVRSMVYLSQLDVPDEQTTAISLAITGLGSIMFFIGLGLLAYFLAVQFINGFRFYKSRFTDEGYLTFTLPVNTHQIFLSSFLNILAWLAISALVVAFSVFLILFFGLWPLWNEMDATLGEVGTIVNDYLGDEPGYVAHQWLTAISWVVSAVYTAVMIMTSLTLGSILAKKHKILAAVGMYYAINMVSGVVKSIVTVIPTMMMYTAVLFDGDYYSYSNLTLIVTMVMQLALMLGGYFFSTSLMKNKLNLP